MGEILNSLSDVVKDIIESIGYPGITFIMFLENVFPPIPSELVLPFSGFLVAEGKLNFFGVWIASVLGAVLGAVVLYYAGAWAGDPLIRQFLRRYGRWFTVSEADYDRALRFFDKHGASIVFFGRLIPIIRSIISIPAGADKMPMPKFLLYATAGSATWNFILIFAGVQLGDRWEDVIAVVEQYQQVTLVVVVLVVVVWLAYRVYTYWNRSEKPASPEEL